MATIIEVKVPDIGDFRDVPVIELKVKVGERVSEGRVILALATEVAAAPASAGKPDIECEMLVLGAGPGGYPQRSAPPTSA